jgi:hypothetical protein
MEWCQMKLTLPAVDLFADEIRYLLLCIFAHLSNSALTRGYESNKINITFF